MPRLVWKRSQQKAGLSPGTLVHVGEKKIEINPTRETREVQNL